MKTFGRPLHPHSSSSSFHLSASLILISLPFSSTLPLFSFYPRLSLNLLPPSLTLLSFFPSLHSRYDIHRDFWGLAVDMFRQFFITQVSTW